MLMSICKAFYNYSH